MSGSAAVLLLICVLAIGNHAHAQSEDPPSSSVLMRRRPAVSTVACYSCVGCSHVTEETVTKKCSKHPDVLRVKKCINFAEKLPHPVNGENRSWVVRGCASERGTCEELRSAYANNPDVELEYCLECEGDKCNGASRFVSEIFFAVFVTVLIPIFGKCTLS